MKLKQFLPQTIELFSKLDENVIRRHVDTIVESGNYRNLSVRVIWDLFYHIKYKNEGYFDRYEWERIIGSDFNDNHIDTLITTAFKQCFPTVYKEITNVPIKKAN